MNAVFLYRERKYFIRDDFAIKNGRINLIEPAVDDSECCRNTEVVSGAATLSCRPDRINRDVSASIHYINADPETGVQLLQVASINYSRQIIRIRATYISTFAGRLHDFKRYLQVHQYMMFMPVVLQCDERIV